MSLLGSAWEVSISKLIELLLAIFRTLHPVVGWISLAHGPLHDSFLHQIKVEMGKESASKMTAIIIPSLIMKVTFNQHCQIKSFLLKLLGPAHVSETETAQNEDEEMRRFRNDLMCLFTILWVKRRERIWISELRQRSWHHLPNRQWGIAAANQCMTEALDYLVMVLSFQSSLSHNVIYSIKKKSCQ